MAMVRETKGGSEEGERCAFDEWKIKAKDFKLSFEATQASPHNTDETTNTFMGSWPYCLALICQGKIAKLESYYNKQREIVEEMKVLDDLSETDYEAQSGEAIDVQEDGATRKERFAIRIFNYANIIQFVIKMFVSVKSISLAIIALTLDSLLYLLPGFILWFTSCKMRRPNPYHYPIGKTRMQPLGILVFATTMAILGIQILIESMRTLISKDSQLALEGTNKHWVIGMMVFVIFMKFNLVLCCKTVKNNIVQAYTKDHLSDVITNTIGLVIALLAARFSWWIDPLGAILLALHTIWEWSKTISKNMAVLVGETAPPEFLQKITYLCWNHHKEIKQIDTMKAYTLGDLYFVEVDIVLPADMLLVQAHDIGESLQNKLECLPKVERAFVHLDYECQHRPEHAPIRSINPP